MTTRTSRAPAVDPDAPRPAVRRWRWLPSWPMAVLAAVSYVPLLLTAPGYVGADTKQYLYLDPGTLLARAPYLWDKHIGMGGVTHQNIGYLFPQGPWYWVFQQLSIPDWVAQRLWTGTILFAAGVGVLVLLRTFGWANRPAFLAAAGYALSPYVLEYVARISAILLPWAGLPWMVAFLVRGLRYQAYAAARDPARSGLARLRPRLDRWRYPALFAIVVAFIGGTNASSLIFAGLAPTIWILFALAGREVSFRGAVACVARTVALTVGVSVWWAAGLTDQAGYGLNVLVYSETVQTVSSASTATEVLRGLGNWFFYGRDALAPWIQPSRAYTQSLWLIAVSFAVPVLALAAAACVRWAHRAYFVTLVVVGTALAVGVYPYDHPSPFGQLFKDFAASSTAGLALRSSPRAVPLVALGLVVLLAAGVEGLFRLAAERAARADRRRRRVSLSRWAPAAAFLAVLALVALDMAPLWRGQFVDPNLRRPENVPSYLTAAAHTLGTAPPLDGTQTRVLVEPGADFSDFRWGETLDPPLPGLMNRAVVVRELIPTGEPASAALVRALDEPLQEGVADPNAFAPIARLMGVGDVLLRSDLQYERFLTPQPVATWAQLTQPLPAGLGTPQTFGPPVQETPAFPFLNEISLGDQPSDPNPPALAAFPVQDPVPVVRAERAGSPLLVAGNADGLVQAAGTGLLDTTGVVLFAASSAKGAPATAPVSKNAALLLTDSNQRRAERWNAVIDNYGYVETATGQPLAKDPNDARLPVFPDESSADQTVAVLSGVQDVEATSYGNPVGYSPAAQPFSAIDGDVSTAWTVGAFADPRGERLQVTLLGPETAPTVTLVQPYQVPATRTITKATLTFAGGPHGTVTEPVDMTPASLTAAGQQVTVPAAARGYTSISFTIDQTSNGVLQQYDGQSGVGLAELEIPGVHASEVLRLPTDLFAVAGSNGLAQPLSILLTRDRVDPQTPYKTDPEQSMAREFTLPTTRTFGVGGTARISAQALDGVIDQLLGRTGVTATSSAALPGSLDARASAALDGNPQTAWTNAFGGNVGSWLQVHSPAATTLSSLNLQVVADGRHSVPTSLELVVDGGKETRTITLPPVADTKGSDATVTMPVTFAPVTGHTFRFVVTSERAEYTRDYFKHTPQILPVAIAELGAPGLRIGPAVSTVQGGCRSDLLSVDGTPVPVEVVGSTTAAVARDGLQVRLCGPPLTLSAGTHVLRTTPGTTTGLDLDQLMLSSAPGGAAADPTNPFPGQPRTAGQPTVQVTHEGPISYDLTVTGATPGKPFWLVLGQSLSPAWQATIAGKQLGPPQLVDGYANGWLVTPTSSSFGVALRWTAQTKVWYGLGISAIAALICLLLVLSPGALRLARSRGSAAGLRRYWRDPLPFLQAPWARDRGRAPPWRTAVAVVVSAALAAFLVSPLAGAIVLAATLLAALVPRGRTLLRVGAVATYAASAAYVLEVQARYRLPETSGWAEQFHAVAVLSWLAVALLLADVLVGWARRDHDGTDRVEGRPGPGST